MATDSTMAEVSPQRIERYVNIKYLGRPSSHSNNKTAAVNIQHRAEDMNKDNQLLQQASSNPDLSNVVGMLLPHNLTASPPDFSRIVSSLGISMPESYPSEHIQRAQCLVYGSKEDQRTECLLMLIHGLSNNMIDIDDMEWTSAFAILREYGILDLKISFKGFQSIAINGFMENLFRAAMNQLVCDPSSQSNSVMAVVKWLLRLGQDPNIHFYILDYDQIGTPLQVAIMCKNVEVVKLLLEEGADPNFEPPTGHWLPPLDLASDGESDVAACMVELLFQYGASQKSDSALRSAVGMDYTEIVKRLLQQGVPGNLNRALHLAIERDHEEIVDILCRQGADICAKLKTERGLVYEQTALSVAAATSLSMTNFILERLKTQYPSRELSSFVTADVLIAATGCNDHTVHHLYQISPNTTSASELGITPLHAAAKQGSLDICKLLFPRYSLYASTTAAPTPLHFACFKGHGEIVEYLIQHNADINAIAIFTLSLTKRLEPEHDWSPKKLKFSMYLTPHEFIVEFTGIGGATNSNLDSAVMLIRAGATPIPRGVVHTAAQKLHPNLLSAALVAGASPNETNETGESALQTVIKTGERHVENRQERSYEAAALLLQHGARLLGGEVVSSIRHRCWSIIDLLLRYGGSFLDTDTEGMTTLEAAIISGVVLYIERVFLISPRIYDAASMCAAIEAGLYWVAAMLLANCPTTSEIEELDTTVLDSVSEVRNLDLLQRNDLKHLLETTALGLAAKAGNLYLLGKMLRSLRFQRFALVPDPFENCFWRASATGTPGPKVRTGSPLALAAMGQTVQAMEAFRELLSSGWQPDTLTWCIIADKGNLSLAQTLYDQGHRLKDPAPGLLETPIREENQKLLLLLLQAGADPNGHDTLESGSRSPMQLAVELGNLDLAKCLLNAGANVNAAPARSYGATALQLAAIKGYLGLAKHLLDLDADVNAAGAEKQGRTALEGAAEHGRLDMLELLLCYGASITGAARCHYVKAVKLATNGGHFAAVELLKSRGGWSEADDDLCEELGSDSYWLL